MSEWWRAFEDLGLWSGVLALIISLYAATQARRASRAAERSAAAAEAAASATQQTASLRQSQLREACIGALAEALPDSEKVTGLITDLPVEFREDWLQLLTSAARRNPRTPERRFEELLAKHHDMWELAATPTELSRREEEG